MSSPPRVLLLLGARSNLGAKIAQTFSTAGYKVALVARSLDEGPQQQSGYHHIRADLSNPDCIPEVFEKVKVHVGIPSVVVYNAVQYTLDDAADPFASLMPEKVSQFHTAMAVNGTTPLIAMAHAVASFRNLPADMPGRTFIFTGNILNRSPFVNRFCFGCAKATCAYGIHFASVIYAKERIRFYYADERTVAGLPVMREIDGPAAGKVYLEIAECAEQRAWHYTYTKDGEYRDFGQADYLQIRQGGHELLRGGRS
ncbi:putative short-chain dehydrogenase protein [Cladophialophora carrionii]|uniref:Putative short-chain dehydrogenase protein n=1 Tax=Cladophialophora carrionii TaxID=86049 RepID=A0A1C1CXD1_9EURO|nr:putative short-chain dehydrogenase protein [Cladophialophora carrionii]